LSFRSAGLSREESAVSQLAASRFLADKAGFGMTRRVFLRKLHYYRHSAPFELSALLCDNSSPHGEEQQCTSAFRSF
jgi:hypothetical protein